MSRDTDIRITDVQLTFEPIPFRAPLKFGGRIVDRSISIEVTVQVETRAGHHGVGIGSMPVGNIWAWPSDKLDGDTTTNLMKKFAEETALLYGEFPEFGHPLDIVFQLSAEYHHLGKAISTMKHVDEVMPDLAQLVSASPFDAALHDAFGRANAINCYNGYSSDYVDHDLSEYLDDQFSGEYLDQYTTRDPKAKMPLYHLVGAIDPLTAGDIEKRIDDDLPETLGEWITAEGLTHLKIKLAGDQLDWDIDRVLAIDKVAAEAQSNLGCSAWFYSCDFNEKCPDIQYVIDFLNKIKEASPAAYDRIQYLEQPTSRHIKESSAINVSEASKLKPVVIDEALVDYESLQLSRELGYSGVALKACKGQTESLLMAAAAQKYGMFLCVQDLTCPGYSFLHSASLAARIPTVAAIEGNARQYCPEPNKKWANHYPGMFEITDGTVETALLNGEGLGF